MDLIELQSKVIDIEIERGFIRDDPKTKLNILQEETGELAKAIRICNGGIIHDKSKLKSVQDELGDVFFVILAIANRYEIDLETAFMEKMKKDSQKVYFNAGISDRNRTF